ncbi:MAG TPA: hypothetical protein VF832_14925 [Longimicrobiales bacterium]
MEEPAVDRLIREVENRVALKEDLLAVVRGVAGTVVIFGTIVLLITLIMAGAITFAAVVQAYVGP